MRRASRSVVALVLLAQEPWTSVGQLSDLVVLKEAAEQTGALCLDGSPGAYYIRRGSGSGVNRWHIHHEGGGWCQSLEGCYQRSKTTLGSTLTYPPTFKLPFGYNSDDPVDNPMMHNWNRVYLKYCDGGSFSGANETVTPYRDATLHFRGKFVLEAMQKDLLAKGLTEATDVVISGCSAGGLSTYLHVDQWAELLKHSCKQPPKVAAMPDSGWFVDYEGPPHYHSGLIWVFNQMNSTSGVNQRCIQAHANSGDQWKCIFAEHTAPHIQTRTFPLQSIFDTWQVRNELASTNASEINAYGARMTQVIEQALLASNKENGIFLDSCSHHCSFGWSNYSADGKTQGEAFQEWYEQGSAALPNKGYFSQQKPFPCKDCCKRPQELDVVI